MNKSICKDCNLMQTNYRQYKYNHLNKECCKLVFYIIKNVLYLSVLLCSNRLIFPLGLFAFSSYTWGSMDKITKKLIHFKRSFISKIKKMQAKMSDFCQIKGKMIYHLSLICELRNPDFIRKLRYFCLIKAMFKGVNLIELPEKCRAKSKTNMLKFIYVTDYQLSKT